MIDPEVARRKLKKFEDQRISLNSKSTLTYSIISILLILGIIISIVNQLSWPSLLIPIILAVGISSAIYYFSLYKPFFYLKSQVKASILKEFMTCFHPKIDYKYHPSKKDVRRIIEGTNLIRANEFYEEDVIIGKLEGAEFYLSEIDLKRDSGKTTITLFKGLLFNLTIEEKDFPLSQIQSKMGFLSRMFNGFKKNEEFDFWFDSQDMTIFYEELSPLFPFIQHLIRTHGDVRIKTAGSSITIMVESKMKLLDEPKLKMNYSFFNPIYYDQIAVQINSLLFIVESFVLGLEQTEIKERLESKALEYAKRIGVKLAKS